MQGGDDLVDNQAIGLAKRHEDSADPIAFIVKPTAFAFAEQPVGSIYPEGGQRNIEPELVTGLEKRFGIEVDFEAALSFEAHALFLLQAGKGLQGGLQGLLVDRRPPPAGSAAANDGRSPACRPVPRCIR